VAALIKKLDKAVNENSDKQLRVFVNLLGDDKEELSENAKKFAKRTKAKNVPFVVPNEFENGPDNYGINAKAAVTVILAGNGQVKANHAAASSKELDVDAVVADVKKILE
jgi:hypothetical protein